MEELQKQIIGESESGCSFMAVLPSSRLQLDHRLEVVLGLSERIPIAWESYTDCLLHSVVPSALRQLVKTRKRCSLYEGSVFAVCLHVRIH